MILTLKELAEYLKLNERTVSRMRENGQIQGIKFGGQWRFNGSEIDKLFFPKESKSSDLPLEEFAHSNFDIPLSRLTNEDRIFLDMKATTVEEAINELTDSTLFNTLVLDINDLREKTMQREKFLSTGVGNGIAIPHPRDPISSLRASGCFVIGRSAKGIDFNAVDGKPVHYFFFSCSQKIDLHLHIMGRIASLLKSQDFMKVLETATTSADVYRAIMVQERTTYLLEETPKK